MVNSKQYRVDTLQSNFDLNYGSVYAVILVPPDSLFQSSLWPLRKAGRSWKVTVNMELNKVVMIVEVSAMC